MYDRTFARGGALRLALHIGATAIRPLVFVFCLLAPTLVHGDTLTRLYKPDATNTDGCYWTDYRNCPGSDGMPMDLVACGKIKFSDPLPRGTIVTRIDVRAGVRTHNAASIFPPEMLLWAMNHAFATQPERVMGMAMEPVSTADTCDPGNFQSLTIEGQEFEGGIPFYNYSGNNVAQVRNSSDGHGVDTDVMELTFHYEPVAVIAFDLSPSVSEIQRRVLIHKFGGNDSYFSTAQENLRNSPEGADRRIEISGTVKSADGAPLSGRDIYLRVTDPPDTASYVPVARRLPGDNADATGGRFERGNADGSMSLVRNLDVTSDSSGRFKAALRVTNFAAGDNYRIEASSVSAFGGTSACGTVNNCYTSGTLVAWKRAYLEIGRMLKRGTFIASTANAGDTTVRVASIKPFAPGDRVVLVHAPVSRIGPSSPATEYWAIERSIAPDGVAPDNPGPAGTLRFTEALPAQFVGIDGSTSYPSIVADFIGVVTGDVEQDYYELNLGYINPLFGDAFTDYAILPSAPLPLVNVIDENESATQEEMHPFALRWFQHFGRNNHQFAFSSKETKMFAIKGARGTTRALNGASYSNVMVPKILGLLATQNSRRLLGEATAHEIAHQWHTNRGSSHTANGSHCNDFKYYDDPSKRCLMYYAYNVSGTTLPEFYDDIVRFHYVITPAGVDSEYRWIRERCEPVPAQLLPGIVDWWTQAVPPCR